MGTMDTVEKEPPDRAGPPPRRIEISLTQLVAGSAAAVCGAWLASRIGVAGTVVGAGFVSALVTILSALYAHGARQASERLVHRLEAVRTRGPLPASYAADSPGVPSTTGAAGGAAADGAGAAAGAGDSGASGASGDTDPMSRTSPLFLPPFDLEDTHGYRWGRIALAALVVFVMGMAAVTIVELIAGHPLACTTAGTGCQGTTTIPLPGQSRPKPSQTPTQIPSPSASSASSAPGSGAGASPSPSGTGSSGPSTSGSASPSTSTTSSVSGSPSVTASPTG
jgi:hypothetical protein